MKNIETDCDASLSQDKSLPTNAFLIEYKLDGMTKFDIAASAKKSEIFDHYYDNYRHDLVNITQCEGRISPRLYNFKPKT